MVERIQLETWIKRSTQKQEDLGRRGASVAQNTASLVMIYAGNSKSMLC